MPGPVPVPARHQAAHQHGPISAAAAAAQAARAAAVPHRGRAHLPRPRGQGARGRGTSWNPARGWSGREQRNPAMRPGPRGNRRQQMANAARAAAGACFRSQRRGRIGHRAGWQGMGRNESGSGRGAECVLLAGAGGCEGRGGAETELDRSRYGAEAVPSRAEVGRSGGCEAGGEGRGRCLLRRPAVL